MLGLDIYRCFVGFNGDQRISGPVRCVLLDVPVGEERRGSTSSYLGHGQYLRHAQPPAMPRSLAATSDECAYAARSRTLLMVGDASPPVTRSMGESSQSNSRLPTSSESQLP